jgi:folate-binding protein YgfZ
MTHVAHLPGRSVLRLSGADRITFLNGLVSNDVALAAPGRAVWAALLTPQGKYLADFFIFAEGDDLLLDCAASQAALLTQRLLRFRLRAQVAIDATGLAVYAAWGGAAPVEGVSAPDPRHVEAGWRVLSETPMAVDAGLAAYEAHRLALGLPDGPQDMEAEKSVLLEGGFDELHGICWTKGCYMGQELTARTRYRGLLKRRLFPVRGAALPAPGTAILAGDREVGEMRSSQGSLGLALLRIDAVRAGVDGLEVVTPEWMRLPGQEEVSA